MNIPLFVAFNFSMFTQYRQSILNRSKNALKRLRQKIAFHFISLSCSLSRVLSLVLSFYLPFSLLLAPFSFFSLWSPRPHQCLLNFRMRITELSCYQANTISSSISIKCVYAINKFYFVKGRIFCHCFSVCLPARITSTL